MLYSIVFNGYVNVIIRHAGYKPNQNSRGKWRYVQYSLFMTMFTRTIQRYPGYKPLTIYMTRYSMYLLQTRPPLHATSTNLLQIRSDPDPTFSGYRIEFITDSAGSGCYLLWRRHTRIMTFWGGSGSADPCIWLMDPDPAIFVIDLQDASKKLIFWHNFFCLLLFEGTYNFSKIKSQNEPQNSRNKGFLTIFAWW